MIKKSIVIIVIVILGFFIYFEFLSPNRYYKDIGSFSSQTQGERASIQQLSKIIDLRFWKSTFNVMWKCSGKDCGSKYRATVYHRKLKTIGYEVDVGSGYAKWWPCQSDEEIHAVANKNGILSDFAH